jgi:hypothetical protein
VTPASERTRHLTTTRHKPKALQSGQNISWNGTVNADAALCASSRLQRPHIRNNANLSLMTFEYGRNISSKGILIIQSLGRHYEALSNIYRDAFINVRRPCQSTYSLKDWASGPPLAAARGKYISGSTAPAVRLKAKETAHPAQSSSWQMFRNRS